jgi:hypothetical protein
MSGSADERADTAATSAAVTIPNNKRGIAGENTRLGLYVLRAPGVIEV